jgi:hypothetical protein
MQIDFHHAVAYVVARLAGFGHSDSCTIAYASQYVDNATNKGTIHFDNGSTYVRIASAHDVFDIDNNCKNDEDFAVWVPFHFLPGNNGLGTGEIDESGYQIRRLICTPDSPLANDMWAACRSTIGAPNSLHRLGITAHVYMDTFAHQLFAGIRHDVNLVFDLEHIEPTCAELLEQLKGLVADALKLGHGAALTDPDLPFLKWQYENSYKQHCVRDNPALFGLATTRLFAQFQYYRGKASVEAIPAQDMKLIDDVIRHNTSNDANERHKQWIELVKRGSFSFGSLNDQEVSELGYAATGPGSWKYQAIGKTEDTLDDIFPYDPKFESSNWKRFHDALKDHQREILEVVLPKYGLPRSFQECRFALAAKR